MFRKLFFIVIFLPFSIISCVSWSLPDEHSAIKVQQDTYEYWLLPSPKQSNERTTAKDISHGPRGVIKKITSSSAQDFRGYLAISSSGEAKAVAYNVNTKQYVPVSKTIRIKLKQFDQLENIIDDYNLTLVRHFQPRLLAFVSVADNDELGVIFVKLKNDSRIDKLWLDFETSLNTID